MYVEGKLLFQLQFAPETELSLKSHSKMYACVICMHACGMQPGWTGKQWHQLPINPQLHSTASSQHASVAKMEGLHYISTFWTSSSAGCMSSLGSLYKWVQSISECDWQSLVCCCEIMHVCTQIYGESIVALHKCIMCGLLVHYRRYRGPSILSAYRASSATVSATPPVRAKRSQAWSSAESEQQRTFFYIMRFAGCVRCSRDVLFDAARATPAHRRVPAKFSRYYLQKFRVQNYDIFMGV